MKQNIEKLGPDDDWDEIHLPQAVELHMITDYQEIFQNFNIRLHYKVQGTYCINKTAVDEYFMLFEKKDEDGRSFTKYVKETNLSEIAKMYDEYKETHMTPQAEMTKPPQRYPLYKSINRKKVLDHDHIKEKDNGFGLALAYCKSSKRNQSFLHTCYFSQWFELRLSHSDQRIGLSQGTQCFSKSKICLQFHKIRLGNVSFH